ncbi:MAG: FkbM family methyltransferase [Bacteroidia bacterium]|nr:FkbM family methyltransferase [Bacteroidia bacterium]
MKKLLRSIQVFFPFLHDLRFASKFIMMKGLNKPHEADFKALHHFTPKPDEVFLDIGSNRGEAILSMLISSKVKNNIIGFEPNDLIFKKLNNNYKNNKRIKLYNIGLADKNDTLDLHVPFYRNWMFDGLSSFDFNSANDWLKTRLFGFNEKHLSIKTVQCEIQMLDNFELNPYFIKIDVQGYELQVLKGAIQTIKSHTPILLIESIDNETIEFLKNYNYEFYTYANNKFVKGTGTLNTFCITQNKMDDLINEK